VFFDECSQRHPAAASKFTACERSASAQAHIKQWAFVAGLQPSEPERAMRSEFWDYRKDLFQKVQALTPAQLAQFFNQDRAPLPVTFQAEAKRLEIYLHDWSI
jgi:hypothetical protein